MAKIGKVWSYIRGHKYLVTIAIFVLIIGVFDENNLIQRIKHHSEMHELNTEIEHYRKQYEENNRQLKEITSNPRELEKVAREKYLMKKADEDIYIFEEDMQKNEKDNR